MSVDLFGPRVEKISLDRAVKAPGPLDEGEEKMPDFNDEEVPDTNEQRGVELCARVR